MNSLRSIVAQIVTKCVTRNNTTHMNLGKDVADGEGREGRVGVATTQNTSAM